MKKLRTLGLILLLAVALSTMAFATEATYASWADAAVAATATEETGDYYVDTDGNVTIYTALGMAWFADQVNNQSNKFDGNTVQLDKDIDLQDANVVGYPQSLAEVEDWDGTNSWTAIGTSASINFQGMFDGNDHTVSGVYINSSEQYQGLFGYVSGGSGQSIQNVGVIDSSITTTHSSGRAGGLVGYITSSSTIQNCYATGDVTGSSHAGGLVGSVYTSSTIENCYATGTVRSNSDGAVGGLVGYVYGSSALTNCYATGEASNKVGGGAAGGLAGLVESSTITSCYAIGKASCDDEDGATGGLVGHFAGNTITNGYYNSNIMDPSGVSTTGLTTMEMTGVDSLMKLGDAWAYAAYTLNEDGTVTAPYPVLVSNQQSPAPSATFDGVLTWEMAAMLAVEDVDYTQSKDGTYTISTALGMAWFADQVNGGNTFYSNTVELTTHINLLEAKVVGYDEETIMADGYDGGNSWPAIGYSEDYAFQGTFDGKGYTVCHVYANCAQSYHGLFGYVLGDNTQSIKNIGVIDSSITTLLYSSGEAGGLVGRLRNYTLENCYSTATVSGYRVGSLVAYSNNSTLTNCYATGDVTSSDVASSGVASNGVAGGFAGYVVSSTLTNCYAIGAVSDGYYVGGFAGYVYDSELTNCYYNSETSHCTAGVADGTDDAKALTTEEMTGLATDNSMELGNGWFFAADVTSETSVTYYYPVLTNDDPDLVPSTTKLFATISVSLADWIYNGTLSTPDVTTDSTGDISYTYSDSEDGTYTDVQPTEVGTYYIKATVATTATHIQATSEPVEFTITAKSTSSNTGTLVTDTATDDSEDDGTTDVEDEDTTTTETTTPTVAGMDDVSTEDYFAEAVEWAVENEVTTGTSENGFSPNSPASRGQVVTFLYRAFGESETAGENTFADVDEDSYYGNAVKWALELGITQGMVDGLFGTEETCTRAQIITFLWRAAGSPEVEGSHDFSDVETGSYYEMALLWAVENGITNGMGDGTFGVDEPCTRAQIVTFLYRVFN